MELEFELKKIEKSYFDKNKQGLNRKTRQSRYQLKRLETIF